MASELMTSPPLLGEKIRDLRERAKLSQVQLAAAAGMKQSRISMIEKGNGGHGLNIGTIMRIADALGVTLQDLISNSVIDIRKSRYEAIGKACASLDIDELDAVLGLVKILARKYEKQ